MATAKVIVELTLDDGSTQVINYEKDVKQEKTQEFGVILVGEEDGGPIMRPNNPPTW